MAAELVTINGIEEVCRDLDQMPAAIVLRAFHSGLEAAGGVLVEELLSRTPERVDENARPEDQIPLREDIQAEITLDAQFRGGYVEVGFGKNGHLANWLEFGHRMIGHKPGKKDLGRVPAYPFMRRAGDAAELRSIDAFIDAVTGSVAEGWGE